MSKILITKNDIVIDEIDNKLSDLNKHYVLVEIKDINKLDNAEIEYCNFQLKEEIFLCRRGKKTKKFTKEQQELIKDDLENGLSIRKAADKYKCSSRTIQQIKNDTY